MTWDKIKFGEIFLEPTRNGVYKSSEAHGTGCKIVNMGEIFAYNFIGNQDMSRISMTDEELEKDGLRKNDLLFARRSLVESGAGKSSIITELNEPLTFESSIIRVRLDETKCYPLFYLYWLHSYAGKSAISALVSGTNVKGIRGSELKNISVDYPNYDVQVKIASILSSYDSLIENNTRRIKILEAMAENLYKEWFVRFRFPGHEHVKIVNGVPEGWCVKHIEDICSTHGGGTPSTSKPEYYTNGTISWVTPTDITNNMSLVLLDSDKKITQDGLDNSSAKLLPPETILMTSRASIGYFAICDKVVCTNQGFIACVPHDNNMRMYLLFNLLSRKLEIEQKANGSTYLEINKTTFRKMMICIPDVHTLDLFEETVYPLLIQTRNLMKQNQNLTKQRDLLLPRLMSGKIDIQNEAEA